MKQLGRIGGVVAALILLLLVTGCSAADGNDKVIAGGSEVFESGEVIEGDVALFGGSLLVREGAQVTGDVALFGGTLTVEGDVGGDVVIMGGTVFREPGSIGGDITNFGGSVLGLDGEGEVPEIEVPQIEPPQVPEPEAGVARVADRGILGTIGSAIFALVVGVMQIVVIGALALGVTLFLPDHVRRIGNAAAEAPVASASLGCLALPAFVFTMILLIVTVVGIPVALFLPFFFLAIAVLGWIGLGYFIGDRLLRSADIRSPRPAAAAAIGAAGLALVAQGADLIPLVGWVVTPLLAMWALGAAIVTRGGRRSYPLGGAKFARQRATAAATAAPAPSARQAPSDLFDPTGDLLQDLARDLGIERELREEDERPPDHPERPIPPEG